jgi:feruloyl esterase
MSPRATAAASANSGASDESVLSHHARRRRPFAATAGAIVLCGTVAFATSTAHAQLACASLLTSFTYPNTTITGATSSTGGAYCAPDTWHLCFTNLPPSCQVTAQMTPTPDSTINVTVWMPTQGYNGRYLGTGNGGYAGSYFQSELAQGINNGFATANTDMGTSPYADGVSADGLAGHPEKWVDFGWRATYLMTQFSKALITAFYGAPPNYSYFAGCSTGGQQALMEAQRFPNDYNGILAGDPAQYRTHLHTVLVAQYQRTHQTAPATGYIPTPSGFDLVNAAVLQQCVGHDGGAASDNFLTNPRVCTFNPASLQCPGNVPGPNCLTSDQVATFQEYYQGPTNPSNGVLIYPGNEPGSEGDTLPPETVTPLGLGMAYNENLNEPSFDSIFKWVFGLTWQWQAFDFNTNVAEVDQVLADDLNATSTDLSQFENNGGKLILYHGWADPLIGSIGSVDYYNAVTATMFGNLSSGTIQQTQNFARLYMAPGMWHCGASIAGGPGPNSFGGMIQQPAPSFDPQHNLLSALTQWVEQGTAPGPVIATKYVDDTPSMGIQMQRPLCVYPQIAQYNGTGDPTLPTSFSCVSGPTNSLADTHDFINGGISDILWRDSSGNLAIWLMNGSTIMNANAAGLGNVPTIWSVVGQRDFNGDGNADILWRDNSGDLAIWLMNGTTLLNGNTAGLGNVPTIWSIAGTDDFNGDGYADILWRNTSTGDLAIWEMNGTAIVNANTTGLGNVPTDWSVAGVGDFNGDGKADILWRNNTNGNVAIWLMNGTTITNASTATFGNMPTIWSVAGVGDFNGDGKSDILWRDASGDLAIWQMNGTTITNPSTTGVGNLSTVWSIAETGDFNGDGNSDILWRDTSGDIAVWYMNGTTIASGTGLGTIPTTFTIQSANAD